MNRIMWYFVMVWMVATACAPAKKEIKNWVSVPAVQTAENASVRVRFEPLKRDKRFFVSFQLVVDNKTDQALTLDWNQTQYLRNGKPYGPFAFRGIDPESIKKAIPPDTIGPGQTFSREIFPVNLVAFTPMREEVMDREGKGLFPGPIPAGQNGIRLVLKQGRKDIVETLTADIQ